MEFFRNPTAIHFGTGSINILPELLKEYTGDILFIAGKSSLSGNPAFEKTAQEIAPFIKTEIRDVSPNPDVEDIFNFINIMSGNKYRCILAAGGGSVIDTAKTLSAFYPSKVKSPDTLRNEIQKKNYTDRMIPVIAVPTTAGTGSETNPWATVWDKKMNSRLSIGDNGLFPAHAVVDPALTITMPLKLTASTGLDTLCHAMEGLWAKKSNNISRLYAIKAVGLIFSHLEGAIKSPANMEHRAGLSLAATLSGVSLSSSKTTGCHAVSYPLTLDYNISHGIACVLTLNEMYQYNKGSIPDEHILEGVMAKGLGHQSFSNFVKNICSLAGTPTRLADYGVKREDLPGIAQRSDLPDSLNNNPKLITEANILDILKQIY